MISIVLGGNRKDEAFLDWVLELPCAKFYNAPNTGELLRFSAMARQSAKMLVLDDNRYENVVRMKRANDPLVVHFSIETMLEYFMPRKLVAYVEIALDGQLNLQILAYRPNEFETEFAKLQKGWPKEWPKIKIVG